MRRLLDAFFNSSRAFRQLARTEKAFQQELALLGISIPAAWFLATTWHGFALLVGSILFLILAEVINTALEAACDAISQDFNADIQLAKDCGSLAVLITILLVAGVWLMALIDRVS